MKKTVGVVVAVLGAFTLLAPTASADKPRQIHASATFPDVNACTLEVDMITLSWTITLHENRMNRVATFRTVVETSSGFSGGGTETEVITSDKQINTFNIRATNGEQVFTVKGHRTIDLEKDEVVMSNHKNRLCAGLAKQRNGQAGK